MRSLASLARAASGGLLGALLLSLSLSVQAAERPYPTLVALGAAWPLNSHQGQATPLVVVDHESEWDGVGTLKVGLRTVSPSLSVTQDRTDWLATEYGFDGTYLAEGNGTDLYDLGTRLESNFFRGNRTSLFVGAHLFRKGAHRASLQVRMANYHFSEMEDQTRADFVRPPSFSEQELGLTLARHGLFHEEGRFEVQAHAAYRHRWDAWSLEPDADATRTPVRHQVTLEDRVNYGEGSEIKGTVIRAGGKGLDLLSGYRVGGLTSDLAVAGYYRNEFRVQEATLVKLRHETAFAEDRVLYVFADWAQFQELELNYLSEPGARRSIAGVAVGFRYGIRSLMGLPIIVTYGEGFGVPEGSAEPHRREVVFVAAAGF